MTPLSPRIPAPALIVAGAALWGTTGTAQALGPAASTPLQVGVLRNVVGGLALVLLVAVRRRLGRTLDVLRGTERAAAAVATVAIGAYPLLFFAGVARAGVALGTLVGIGSVPVATGVLARLVGERPTHRWLVGTAITLVGAGLLVGPASATVDVGGLLLAIGAGVAYAVYTLATKRILVAGFGPTETMAATYATAGLVLAPLLTRGDLGWVATPGGLALAGWLGVATVAVAYLLYAQGLARLTSATVASLTLTEPLTATLLAVLVLGERLTGRAAVGAALVAAGLVVVSVRRRRPA